MVVDLLRSWMGWFQFTRLRKPFTLWTYYANVFHFMLFPICIKFPMSRKNMMGLIWSRLLPVIRNTSLKVVGNMTIPKLLEWSWKIMSMGCCCIANYRLICPQIWLFIKRMLSHRTLYNKNLFIQKVITWIRWRRGLDRWVLR
jgi:hypothetical protein